jgi:hypothetical protein
MKKRFLSDFQLFSSHSVIKSFISVLLVSKFSPVFVFKTFCNQNNIIVYLFLRYNLSTRTIENRIRTNEFF